MEPCTDKQDKAKQNEIEIEIEIQSEGTFSLKKGENVLSVLIEHGMFEVSHCAGHGTCGRCRVCFVKGAPIPLPADRRFFKPDELRKGWRLACKAKPQADCVIKLPESRDDMFVLDSSLFLSGGEQMTERESGLEAAEDLIAIADLGTTTLVLLLVEAESAKVIRTHKQLNPQRKYGADVVSRMEAALSGKAVELSDMVNKAIGDVITQWKAEGLFPKKLVLAGNTIMTHLYLKQDVSGLSKAPFNPVTTVSLPFESGGIQGVTMPSVSAFVGGDITAGMLVCKKQMETQQVSYALLIDLGTNGEMVLFTPEGNYATATAAGPAFEGGFEPGLYGADVIALVAELLTRGVIDETGLMVQPYFETGYKIDTYCIRQEDIRTLQTAKAAVFAGIRILLEEAGVLPEEVEQVYLAGGFGYKLSTDAACQIGLIPSAWRDRTIAVGNTSLAGAYLYACGGETEELVGNTRSINLAEKNHFNEYYLQAMNLREERDFL